MKFDKPPNILQRLVSWFKRIGVNESGQSTWKSLGAYFAMSVAVLGKNSIVVLQESSPQMC